MPKIVREEVPEGLKPYVQHGVELSLRGKKWESGDCPFCGKEGKFAVNEETTVFHCHVCGETGNVTVFVQKLWELSDKQRQDFSWLVEQRGYLDDACLVHWGIVKSATTGEWLVPGYGADGTMRQLYRYVRTPERWTLFPTPTLSHQLHGVNLYDKKKSVIWLCEGPWDGIALWEILSKTKQVSEELVLTGNPNVSLLSDSSVLAVPGCGVFQESWLPLFAGKTVNLMYDSDWFLKTCPPCKKPFRTKDRNSACPKCGNKDGVVTEPSGYAGMLKVAELLAEEKNAPREINLLKWGPDGFDPELKSGHDVRDTLRGDVHQRIAGFESLVERMEAFDVSPEVVQAKTKSEGKLECLPCDNYKTLVSAWRQAMKWTDGLDHALTCMLASVVSTKAVGDQLWFKVVSPASSGKSVLCEALSVADEFVLAKSTIRGFHSGFKQEGGDGEDHSLLAQLNGKTLVTKDGDTLLQSPNLPQILAEARDVYDRTSRTHYRNAMSKDYNGLSMTWLLCGTNSLRSLDQSELGERFLDCVIMDKIDDELEDEILWRVVNRADRNLAIEANGQAETHQDPEMTLAMRLTGGYVCHLRRNAQEILSQVDADDEAKRYVTRLGKFVAFMRARPSTRQDETAEREFAARLVSQHWRLAKCLAAVLNRREVDDEVVQRTKRVALDTARGQTLELAGTMYATGDDGEEMRTLAARSGRTEDKTRTMMRFLQRIEVAEPHTVKREGFSKAPRWRLTKKLRKLYSEVMGE